MKIIKKLNILTFIFILTTIHLKAQKFVSNKMIEIEFRTIEQKSNDVVIASVIEILSDGERIGITNGDYDGIAKFSVCSKEIINEQIAINVYGMKCKPFQSDYRINSDSKITINLDYGATKYKTLEDRKLILVDLNIPICDVEINELETDNNYKHCDGRIKKKEEIPNSELSEWERIEN
jgi:hypothetical protein